MFLHNEQSWELRDRKTNPKIQNHFNYGNKVVNS